MKKLHLAIYLLVLFGVWSTSTCSAEFEDSDVLPHIKGIGFDPGAVGFVASTGNYFTDLLGARVYFIYDRSSRKMAEVDEKQFQERFSVGVLIEGPRPDPARTYDLIGETANGVVYRLHLNYCGEGNTDDTRNVIVGIGNKTVRVGGREECTSVSSVEIVNGQLWLGTAYFGEGGLYRAEGIIVQDLNDASVLARITSLSGWITRLHVDPLSKNVWVITENGIYEISPQFKILSIHLYYHDFDPSTGEPRFSFSNKATRGNPFSVVSRLLPSGERKDFYKALTTIPKADLEQFTLYDFFMCCDFRAPKYPESFRPLVPFFIKASSRDDTVLQNVWRQSLCRMGGPETKQYCHRAR